MSAFVERYELSLKGNALCVSVVQCRVCSSCGYVLLISGAHKHRKAAPRSVQQLKTAVS